MHRLLKQSFSRKYCLAPLANSATCSGRIVSAHSIQRNGQGLKQIAKNGHVFTGRPTEIRGTKVVPIGIGNASTFTGFCDLHDTEIFRPIEAEPNIFSHEQLFLLLYRPLAMEVFLKRAAMEHAQQLLKSTKNTRAASAAAAHLKGTEKSLP
jgi:hypothetical protein